MAEFEPSVARLREPVQEQLCSRTRGFSRPTYPSHRSSPARATSREVGGTRGSTRSQAGCSGVAVPRPGIKAQVSVLKSCALNVGLVGLDAIKKTRSRPASETQMKKFAAKKNQARSAARPTWRSSVEAQRSSRPHSTVF